MKKRKKLTQSQLLRLWNIHGKLKIVVKKFDGVSATPYRFRALAKSGRILYRTSYHTDAGERLANLLATRTMEGLEERFYPSCISRFANTDFEAVIRKMHFYDARTRRVFEVYDWNGQLLWSENR